MKKNNVIIISGPTATGKTQMGIQLALRLKDLSQKAAIVNFDSLLFYKELNIGTAKPTPGEMALVEHFLVDVAPISSPLNAASFVRMALPLMEDLHQKNRLIFLIGGSGFYLQALMEGMYESPNLPHHLREKSDNLYQREGIDPFWAILGEKDPLSLQRLHRNDHYRIRRAVEHLWCTNTPFSRAKESLEEKKKCLPSPKGAWNILHCHLDIPKGDHQTLIEKRTEGMLANNFELEVAQLLRKGYSGRERPLKAIGYREMVSYLKGEFSDLEACKKRIILSTRQLAKAQRTWFNRIQEKVVYHPFLDQDKIYQHIVEFLKEKE